MELAMTANHSVLSSAGTVASNSVTPLAGGLSAGNRQPPESFTPNFTGNDGDPSLLSPTWKGKETVNVANDPSFTSHVIPYEKTKADIVETDVEDSETESVPIKVAISTVNTFKKFGSGGPSNLLIGVAEEIAAVTPRGGTAESYVGQQVGPYEVTGELGRGGMGVVYKARHKLLRREVALKMILRPGGDSEVISRFREEARSVATLKHPGIVQIHEYGEHQGVPWFSLEFVEGKTLAKLTSNELLKPERAARIIADVAAAAAYAHDRGILHRDIKPANVLVAAGDVAKLTDFGLAKQVTSDEEASDHKTVDGQIIGTPGFMPPEQARGNVALIGPHSDQYSLGATLYFLLTGRALFVGSPIDVVLQVMNSEPLTVRQLQPTTPLDLETICLKATSKEPAHRYPDCAAFEADLRRFLRHEPIVARPIGTIERAIRWCRRNPLMAIPVFTTVASVLIALGVSMQSAVALSTKNSAIQKKNDEILTEKNKVEAALVLAEENEKEAKKNAKLAYQRAVDAKDTVAEMLSYIRNDMPASEAKLRVPREKLLRRASQLLELLPDNSGDDILRTGLEKARILQERYLTALELGEPSKAIEHLDAAESILRERNNALGTDATRKNLQTVLYHQVQARTSAKRNMEKICQIGKESLSLLNDVADHPNPVNFDADRGSIPRIDTLTEIMIQGYQHALTLKNLGRVHEGLDVLERAITRFDEAMADLRVGPFKQMTDDQWDEQKRNFRGMLSDQDQLHAILLASAGRDREARDQQSLIMANVRKLVASQSTIENKAKLSLALLFTGDLARQRGQIDEAIASYEESVDITRELYQDNPKLEDRRSRYNVSLMRLAGVLYSRNLPRARLLYSEASRVAQEMVQADDRAIAKYFALALVSPFSGPPSKAVDLAEEILKRVEPGTSPDAEVLINVARVFAASAEAESLRDTPDRESIEHWKQRSLSLTADAVKSGYRDGVFLAGEPDFTSIRTLPEFQALLEQCKDK
jgi:serine/threonine protein kinase